MIEPQKGLQHFVFLSICSMFSEIRNTDPGRESQTLFPSRLYSLAKRLSARAQQQILKRSSVALTTRSLQQFTLMRGSEGTVFFAHNFVNL